MVDRTYRLSGGPGDFRPARGEGYGVWAIDLGRSKFVISFQLQSKI